MQKLIDYIKEWLSFSTNFEGELMTEKDYTVEKYYYDLIRSNDVAKLKDAIKADSINQGTSEVEIKKQILSYSDPESDNESLLHIVFANPSKEMIEVLTKGLDATNLKDPLSAQDDGGNHPIGGLVREGEDAVDVLIKIMATFDTKDKKALVLLSTGAFQETMSHYLVEEYSSKLLNKVLEFAEKNGCLVQVLNAKNGDQNTVLHYAILEDNLAFLQKALSYAEEKGILFDALKAQGMDNENVVALGSKNGNEEIIKLVVNSAISTDDSIKLFEAQDDSGFASEAIFKLFENEHFGSVFSSIKHKDIILKLVTKWILVSDELPTIEKNDRPTYKLKTTRIYEEIKNDEALRNTLLSVISKNDSEYTRADFFNDEILSTQIGTNILHDLEEVTNTSSTDVMVADLKQAMIEVSSHILPISNVSRKVNAKVKKILQILIEPRLKNKIESFNVSSLTPQIFSNFLTEIQEVTKYKIPKMDLDGKVEKDAYGETIYEIKKFPTDSVGNFGVSARAAVQSQMQTVFDVEKEKIVGASQDDLGDVAYIAMQKIRNYKDVFTNDTINEYIRHLKEVVVNTAITTAKEVCAKPSNRQEAQICTKVVLKLTEGNLKEVIGDVLNDLSKAASNYLEAYKLDLNEMKQGLLQTFCYVKAMVVLEETKRYKIDNLDKSIAVDNVPHTLNIINVKSELVDDIKMEPGHNYNKGYQKPFDRGSTCRPSTNGYPSCVDNFSQKGMRGTKYAHEDKLKQFGYKALQDACFTLKIDTSKCEFHGAAFNMDKPDLSMEAKAKCQYNEVLTCFEAISVCNNAADFAQKNAYEFFCSKKADITHLTGLTANSLDDFVKIDETTS